jgi:hypothetical protein
MSKPIIPETPDGVWPLSHCGVFLHSDAGAPEQSRIPPDGPTSPAEEVLPCEWGHLQVTRVGRIHPP